MNIIEALCPIEVPSSSYHVDFGMDAIDVRRDGEYGYKIYRPGLSLSQLQDYAVVTQRASEPSFTARLPVYAKYDEGLEKNIHFNVHSIVPFAELGYSKEHPHNIIGKVPYIRGIHASSLYNPDIYDSRYHECEESEKKLWDQIALRDRMFITFHIEKYCKLLSDILNARLHVSGIEIIVMNIKMHPLQVTDSLLDFSLTVTDLCGDISWLYHERRSLIPFFPLLH
jgi:hypothetical protein